MTDRVRRALDEETGGIVDDPMTGGVAPAAPHEVPLLNIANVLTVFRIVLVPVFVVALFVDDGHSTAWRITATVIFALAALTDRYDGRLARERGLVTEFGKLADPIADKALIGAALIGLSVLGEVSWWVTGIIVARELGVTALRFWVLRHGVIPASRGGKLKTLLQSLAIGFYLLPLDGAWHLIAVVLMAAAVVVTVVTACDYLWQAIALRAKGRAAR
ncbi:MAG: CDP-diacylglycerol--glycerol-3-phosphate 3-phosphatidyltransferase [Gordonia amarae]